MLRNNAKRSEERGTRKCGRSENIGRRIKEDDETYLQLLQPVLTFGRLVRTRLVASAAVSVAEAALAVPVDGLLLEGLSVAEEEEVRMGGVGAMSG